MTLAIFIATLLTVAPMDRFALGDRLFNRGEYVLAMAEYASLKGEDAGTIPQDELIYRLAECDRLTGNADSANCGYRKLLNEFPLSRLSPRARLQLAMSVSGAERIRMLKMLDSDGVEPALRAVALYRLGEATQDVTVFARSVSLDPKGPYASYARLARAAGLAKSSRAEDRRAAVSQYLDVAFGKDSKLAEPALYMAAASSHSFGQYGEASSLYRRYLKKYPSGGHAQVVREGCIACEYALGRYSEAAALCGNGGTEGIDYWLMAATMQLGDRDRSAELAKKYLEAYPVGVHRKQVTNALNRLEYAKAESSGDLVRMVECARRIAENSTLASDRLRLGWAYERAARTNEAIGAYSAVAVEAPGTQIAAEAMFRKGGLEFAAAKWMAAELSLKESMAGKLESRYEATANYLRGVAACRMQHAEEGAAMLEKAIAKGLPLEEDREARLIVADVDYNAGRTNKALNAYCRLIREGAAGRMSAAKMAAVGAVVPVAERKICAQALVGADSPEWRQTGYAMLGEVEELNGAFQAAAAAWEKCAAEKCETAALARILPKLGMAKFRAGDREGAMRELKRAVALNATDGGARVQAYMALAEVSIAGGDREGARGYLTVVSELFSNSPMATKAQKMLKTLEEK